jgi:hypothetical protein
MVIPSEQLPAAVWPPDRGGGLDSSADLAGLGHGTSAQVVQSHRH